MTDDEFVAPECYSTDLKCWWRSWRAIRSDCLALTVSGTLPAPSHVVEVAETLCPSVQTVVCGNCRGLVQHLHRRPNGQWKADRAHRIGPAKVEPCTTNPEVKP